MRDFRIFSGGGCEWGDWEDNFGFDDPNDRNGACAYFDAWPHCSDMQFRVWHIKEDLGIELTGEGFKITERKTKFFPDDDGEVKDTSSYCTTLVFQLTKPQGMVSVVIPSEDLFQEDCSIKWDEQYIYDIDDQKAHLKIKSTDHYEIKEILSVEQQQHYVLQDRYFKLKSITRKMGDVDLIHQLNLAWLSGDFDIKSSP